MRLHRAFALLAAAGAMLVASASVALVSTGAAVAAPAPRPAVPPQGYPLPPPKLTTNRGTVKVGQKVHLAGNHFGYREKVVVILSDGSRLIATTDQFGRFSLNVKLTNKGKIKIVARGKVSHLSASVTITVVGKKGKGHLVPAAPHVTPVTPLVVFTPLLPDNTNLGLGAGSLAQNSAGSANLVANSDELTPASGQFPLGAVGAAAALLGVGLVVVLTVKRRRGAAQD